MGKRNARTALLAALLIASLPGRVTAAGAQDITSLDCIVEPEMTIELSAPVEGVVGSVAVDKSDRITSGQVLATLESSVEQALVALARARADMDDEIASRRIELDLARDKLARVVELYNKQTIPGLEKDEAEAVAALAELALKRAGNNRKLAALELQRAEADLAMRSVVSPIDGVVMDRYVHPGESVKDRPLLKVAKIDPMRVEIIAHSKLFGRIQPGMQADIVVEGPRETRHQAVVTVVDGLVDAASGTFGIRLTLPNAGNDVVGGLKCTALFDLAAPGASNQ